MDFYPLILIHSKIIIQSSIPSFVFRVFENIQLIANQSNIVLIFTSRWGFALFFFLFNVKRIIRSIVRISQGVLVGSLHPICFSMWWMLESCSRLSAFGKDARTGAGGRVSYHQPLIFPIFIAFATLHANCRPPLYILWNWNFVVF